MRPKVKICGITRREDAILAESLDADAVGFIFHRSSPRFVHPDHAGRISAVLGPFIARVGVFVDETYENIMKTVRTAGLTAVQLHGCETPETAERIEVPVIKAFRAGPDFSPAMLSKYHVSAYLLDTYVAGKPGGTGKTFDWNIAGECGDCRLILAGGLGPGNIQKAITSVMPWGVDISSGVEQRPGVKDHDLLRQLFDNIDGSVP